MYFNRVRGILALMLVVAAGCEDRSIDPVSPPPVIVPPVGVFQEGLWSVSGTPSEIVRLDPSHLLVDGAQVPDTKLSTSGAGLFTLNSIAFDKTGTMWVASQDDSLLLGFAPREDGRSGSIAPRVIISSNKRSVAGPTGIAFARDGSLWVANRASGTIVRFQKDQLTASGSPAPSVVISGAGHPTGLAFDAAGSLWVTDILANTVSKYVKTQLVSSGNKQPAVVISSDLQSLVNPSGIAFDSFNNMWIVNTGSESVVKFRPPQLDITGSPSPIATLTAPHSTLGIPSGIAFDQDGSLWIIGGGGLLSKFTAGSIAASGPADPVLQIDLTDHVLFWSIAFFPVPSGFPLN